MSSPNQAWIYPETAPPLRVCLAHVWRVDCRRTPHNPHTTLSAEEWARAHAFRFEHDRARYIAAHTALRHILARYVPLHPAQIAFVRGSYGKPAIAQPHQVPVHFNLAHSGDWALVGVTHCEAIGADIETHRNLPDLESVARRFFSPNETRDLMAIPDSQRIAAFFRVWTRKEAYVKASGHGLHKPLDSFDVSVNADARVLRDVAEDLAMDHWHMGDMPTISGHTGAVVVAHRSDVPDTICWIQDSD